MTTPPAALPPVGFWSYTRSDDDSARGKLSQLRVLVANELQHLVGREPVRLFQDTRAIPPGTQWEDEIRDALGQSSFLVPIVTPALLQSEWCCREIAIFHEREQALGRADLIFPVHYIDTAHLDPAKDYADPAVFALLAGRQWIDFRDHRLRAAESEAVAHKVAEIAAALSGALRRRPRAVAPAAASPPVVAQPPPATDPDATIRISPAGAPPLRKPPLVAAGLGAVALIAFLGFALTRGTPPTPAPNAPITTATPVTKDPPPAVTPTTTTAPHAATPPTSNAQRPATAAVHDCDRLAQSLRSNPGQWALVDGVAFDAIDVPRARAACDAAVAAYPSEPRFRAWLGRVLDKGGLPAEAAAAFRIAAERGHPIAQNNLGVMLRDGRGITRDDAQAVQWFRRASEQGYADAQLNLGIMLEYGLGIARDDAQAVEWYRRAAEQGNAAAQANLGVMLRDGTGIARDDAQAVQWFRRAAEQGNADGQNNLGVMLENGRGIARDDAQAVEWYRRAAEQGNADGQNNLGFML
ncbi:MAG: toll/interleukin-1 receptor domain-containing protein, partial [Roseomonas sp.]|nr:toll/interleukin-1 receptor domain-containing protein [Roseomonas sp.]